MTPVSVQRKEQGKRKYWNCQIFEHMYVKRIPFLCLKIARQSFPILKNKHKNYLTNTLVFEVKIMWLITYKKA